MKSTAIKKKLKLIKLYSNSVLFLLLLLKYPKIIERSKNNILTQRKS